MDDSTAQGMGGGRYFPSTRWSIIQSAAGPDTQEGAASLDELAQIYWRPVYAYFRRKWNKSSHDASDLTQEFFTSLTEKEFLQDLSPQMGKFRSYIMAALDNFARYQHRHEGRKKRGGGLLKLSLENLEGFEPSAEGTAEEALTREWARVVMNESLKELEGEYRKTNLGQAWEIFCLRDVKGDDLRYEDLAKKFDVRVTDITNILFRARKRLRELVLMRVRDTVTSEEEAQGEMKELFG